MTVKDLEWLKGSVEDESVMIEDTFGNDWDVVETDTVINFINEIDNTGCNWKPSGKSASLTQVIRHMEGMMTHEEPQNAPPLNPKAILHSNITAELNAIYIAKNSDYGDAFGETYKKLGIISAVTRITDKVNRLQSLATKSESERLVKDESIRDTLMDLSNYAILALIEMDIERDSVGEKVVTVWADNEILTSEVEYR